MPAVRVTNNAYGSLLTNISPTSTTITLQAGEGSRFPSVTLASGDFFFLSLINSLNEIEIIKVTNRVSDTLTVVRGQDGTTARNYLSNNCRIELRPVAALFNALPNRELLTADYQDNSVTAAKLATTGVVAGNYGGNGVDTAITVNSKGQLTSVTNSFGYVQKNTFDFTSSGATQTWTKPSNAGKLVRVQLWGAGGSGGANPSGLAGGGGGGGSYVEGWYSVSDLGTTASIVIGGGGASQNTDTAGEDGENSTFVSGSISLTAYGGGGGGTAGSGGAGGGGAGEFGKGTNGGNTSQTGAVGGVIGGGDGGTGNTVSAVLANNGGNAKTIFGGGGGGGGTPGNSGTFCIGGKAIYGGGGGGGGYNSSTIANPSGGASIYGGAGGAGATGTSNAANGSTPGGGGGGSELTGVSGAGGNGRVIVTVW